jgi:hypothetical protein
MFGVNDLEKNDAFRDASSLIIIIIVRVLL